MGGSSPNPASFISQPSIAPELAVLQAQQMGQNANFEMALKEQPALFQMARDLASQQQMEGGKTLTAAQNLATAQQALGGQALTGAQQLAANQAALNTGYLGAGQQLAAGQQALGAQALKSQAAQAAGQQGLAQNILGISAGMAPEAFQYNADQTSKEAADLGMATLARQRQAQQLANPQAEAMRASMGQKIADLTSDKANKDWLNTLLKQGIVQSSATGVPLASSAGGAAYGDISQEQKRQRDLQNLQIQQAYVNQNNADIQNAMAQGMSLEQAKQAVQAKNTAQRNAWMGNVLQQANQLGDVTSRAQQGLLGATENYANQIMGTQANLLGQTQNFGNQAMAQQGALGNMAYGLGNQALDTQGSLLQALQNQNQQSLGTAAGLLGQIGQTSMGNLQNLSNMQNQGYQNLMGAVQTGQQEQQNYQNMLYQGAVQNAASQNSMFGSGLGALGSIGGMAAMAAICWVAREVYGEQNPAWVEFRNWLLSKGSPRRLTRYIQNGPKIAEYISTRPGWKNKLRKWMDRCRASLA